MMFTIPILFLAVQSFSAEYEVWDAFIDYQFSAVLWQTFVYGGLVATLATCIGGTWGFICARYDFYGRRLWQWLIPAPLAIPVYVYAFIYLAMWNSWVEQTRPAWLLITLFSFAASPYAYLLSFQAFSHEPKDLAESSAIMGLSRFEYLRLVRWPLAKPLLLAAFFVILTEFIADFGAAEMFGLTTFSTAIYKLWSAYMSFGTAALVSMLLLLSIMIILFVQSKIKNHSYNATTYQRRKLSLSSNLLINIIALIQSFATFIAPVAWLVWMASGAENISDSWQTFITTASLSGSFAAIITIIISLIIFVLSRKERFIPAIMQFGYALPGTLLAVAVTVPFFYLQRFGLTFLSGVLGGIALMFLAWSIRFLKVIWEPIAKNRARLPDNIEEAARLYEPNYLIRWTRLFFPLIKGGMLSAGLLVFLETAKELPIALLTRPIGMSTLSIKTFEYTAESQWDMAAIPALLIVILGTLGLLMLLRQGKNDA